MVFWGEISERFFFQVRYFSVIDSEQLSQKGIVSVYRCHVSYLDVRAQWPIIGF